ncbi:MAG: hypothetical protein H0Z38_05255 [Firmicutes bacterium]|nr:hypothetical protein [Bacillota bacterium]
MAETASLRRYTPEEDNLILNTWYNKEGRRDLAKKLDRPLGGLAYRFYQLLKERNIQPKEYRRLAKQGRLEEVLNKPVSSQQEAGRCSEETDSAENEDLLEALKYFPARARKIELELELIKKQVNQLREEKYTGLPEFLQSFKKYDELKQENIRLKDHVEHLTREKEVLQAELASERQRLEAERKELREVYDDLEAIFSEFMRLSSVDKIRVLGDFASRLEVTVDKFGNVVKLKRSL